MILWMLTALGLAQDCAIQGVVDGTAGQAQAAEARESAGAIYGAVETLNREVLARIPVDGGAAAYAGDTMILGVAKLPMERSSSCPRGAIGNYQYDVNSANFAGAYRKGPVTLMYSTSAQMNGAPSNNTNRAIIAGVNTIGGLYWVLAAPFIGADNQLFENQAGMGEFGVNYDFVLGASADLVAVDVGAGYVGSTGFYVTGLSRPTRLFARAVTSENVGRLPLAQAGLDRLALGEMFTTLYARRIETANPGDNVPLLQRPSLTSTHVMQEAIGGMVDVGAGLTVLPKPNFYDVKVRVHEKVTPGDLESRGLSIDQVSGFYAGVTNSRAQPEYGLDGGPLPQAGVRFNLPVDEKWLVTAAVALNDDEVLVNFPYARNSVLLRISATPAF